MINKITIVGRGNVAHHLNVAFAGKNLDALCVSSRKALHNRAISKISNEGKSDSLLIDKETDLVIIAVSDDAIAAVTRKIPSGNYIIVHTSGSIPIAVFKNKFKKYGVFYPLQSFSKTRKVDFSEIPILIEGSDANTTKVLMSLASRISNRVEEMDSEQRGMLHLSAVIANNFVNFLADKSYEFLEQNNIDGSLLQPLMKETIARLQNHHPNEMQTGPAKRNDKKVIEKHLKQLESDPNLQSLYRLISQQIIEKYHGGKL